MWVMGGGTLAGATIGASVYSTCGRIHNLFRQYKHANMIYMCNSYVYTYIYISRTDYVDCYIAIVRWHRHSGRHHNTVTVCMH